MALTVLQPWAWAIAHGGKRVENRGWATRRRERVAIHAGAGWDPRAVLAYPPLAAALAAAGRDVAWLKTDPPRGAVVAVAQLVDCHPSRGSCCSSPWAQRGSFHLVLDDVQALADPVPAVGRQRFWDLPPAVEGAVVEQLLAAADPAPAQRACRVCGCTQDDSCIDGIDGACSWVPGQPDLCTACA